MKTYKSKSGKESGVISYNAGDNYITIRFRNGDVYTYSYASAGERAVETMKTLAQQSHGLSTYISQHKPGFE